MSNFLKEVSGVPRGTAMALTDLPSISNNTFLGNISGSAGTPSALTISQLQTSLSIPTSSSPLPINAGGTDNGSLAVTAGGVLYTDGTKFQNVGVGTANQILTSNGSSAPQWANNGSVLTPSITALTSTGSQTGILITVTTTSITATAGATYTNNSNTYTLLNSPSSSTGPIFFSGTGTTSGTTFTKATGTGPTTIVANAAGNIQTLATYTTPSGPAPLYLKLTAIGGGGGGGGSNDGGTAGGTGGAGGSTSFGVGMIYLTGGAGGPENSQGGAGGTATLGTGPSGLALTGAKGGGGSGLGGTSDGSGWSGYGGVSPFGGGGSTGDSGIAGGNAVANTGSGGGGANLVGGGSGGSGAGGGAGGYAYAFISSPATTYYYTIGTGGAAGTAGTSGAVGGTGANGVILIEAYFQ